MEAFHPAPVLLQIVQWLIVSGDTGFLVWNQLPRLAHLSELGQQLLARWIRICRGLTADHLFFDCRPHWGLTGYWEASWFLFRT